MTTRMKPQKKPLEILTSFQNMTEGPPKGRALRRADLFMGCEVDLKRLRPWINDRNLKFHLPDEDRHQIIVWNPRVLHFEEDAFDYTYFHRSGEHEGWNLRTPARGLLSGPGEVIRTGDSIEAGTTWVLNSWGKPNEQRRREIVEETTLPKIKAWVKNSDADIQILTGDFNNFRWAGNLPNMRQIHKKGLDRMYVRGAQTSRVFEGPVTGVGNDLKHRSLNTRVRVSQ